MGQNNQYTLCGLGFLLLKRNLNKEDIFEAINLFQRAGKIPRSEIFVNLGLWVAYTRIGNEAKSLEFKIRYEQSEKVGFEIEDTETSIAAAKFNQVKDSINVSTLTDSNQYRIVITTILIYVQSILMVRQMRNQLFNRAF